MVGTFFGGNKKIIKILSKEIEKILITDMIEKNMINNEQIALGILYKRNPDLFYVYKDFNSNQGHLPFFNFVYRK